jgi:PPK2 family polyphosphate:nucleotide phosphotransferase
MFIPPASSLAVPFDSSFDLPSHASSPGDSVSSKKSLEKQLKKHVKTISSLQRKLYAHDRFSILLVFQAMDAAGKDGTIRAVMSGVNPAGCQVFSFKSPSSRELDQDYMWRTNYRLPERGRIGIFNRSYYEEVLAVRVRPEYLANQRLPDADNENIWDERFESIRDQELHLARNGTVILKFWLNVSRDEQKRRFMERLKTPEKYWKFSKSDLSERGIWDDYMTAYQSLLNETSRSHAPWFAIPADNKPYMRSCVANILATTMKALPMQYPEQSTEQLAQFDAYIAQLQSE